MFGNIEFIYCVRQNILLVYFVESPYILIKVVSYCFLKSGKKDKFQPQKVYMNISEKNETKAMHWITFRASNRVNGKVFHLFL